MSNTNSRTSREKRAQVQPFSYNGALLSDACRNAFRAQPSRRGYGCDYRSCDFSSRLQLLAAEYLRSARRDSQTEWLLDSAVWEVSRGTGIRSDSDWPIRSLAYWFRLRTLFRFSRRRRQSLLPTAVRRHHSDRTGADAGRGLSPDGGSGGQNHRLDPSTEGDGARQAILYLLRAGRDPRAAPRSKGLDRQIQR